MKRIALTKGKFAIVDDADFEWLNQWRWYCQKGKYASRTIRIGKRYTHLPMHRFILNAPSGKEVDHINGDGLDNRRLNLRVCTTSQNQANRTKAVTNTSGFKGVHWDKKNKRWRAQITFKKQKFNLGNFVSILDAAKAYELAGQRLFGQYHST